MKATTNFLKLFQDIMVLMVTVESNLPEFQAVLTDIETKNWMQLATDFATLAQLCPQLVTEIKVILEDLT